MTAVTLNEMSLTRNALGRLSLTDGSGQVHAPVVPVRAFPIAAPEEGVSLVDGEGHELVWIARLTEVPPAARQLIESELATREFVPEIERILEVSSYATPSTWTVQTNRGLTRFVLKGEEDIRRLVKPTLLIADVHGIQYLIRDPQTMDRGSRKILDRFL